MVNYFQCSHLQVPPFLGLRKVYKNWKVRKKARLGSAGNMEKLCIFSKLLRNNGNYSRIVIYLFSKWSFTWINIFLSSKLWSSQLWTQFKQGLQRVWTREIAIPVRRSNQLSYEATDVGSWTCVSSNEPVKNECEVIYEMFHILKCGFEIK